MTSPPEGLRALVVDDEQPVLDELVFLLGRDDRIARITTASSGAEALRRLDADEVDLLFLDIAMPGLSGMDIARVVSQFRTPPSVVFVTAHENHAVEAFELGAVDYLLKPIREDRLRESVRRATESAPTTDEEESIAVELAGVTRFVRRSQVTYAEAQGDYVRLHVVEGGDGHLVRTALSGLAEEWEPVGFVRVHRSTLVNLAHVIEVRMQSGRCSVLVPSGDGTEELQVARRHTRGLRERIGDRAL